MRKLTLIRKKSFVASLMKVFIYVTSNLPGDKTLEGLNCRKVGELTNGKQETYEIPEEGIHLFVVFDRLLPDAFHCKKFIPPGKADVTLYTKPKLNPFLGNPFQIDEY